MFEKLDNEIKSFLLKIIIPAIITLLAKMSVMLRDRKLTWFKATSIVVCGLASASIFGSLVIKNFSIELVPLVISGIVMTSERLVDYIIYKFNVEPFIIKLLEKIIEGIKK